MFKSIQLIALAIVTGLGGAAAIPAAELPAEVPSTVQSPGEPPFPTTTPYTPSTPSPATAASPDVVPAGSTDATWTGLPALPPGIPASARTVLMLGLLSLAPAALLMTTSFVRLTIVLGLLRQALGSPNLPSQQVLTSLSLCLTLLVMQPTWSEVYREAIAPYMHEGQTIDWSVSYQRGVRPIRDFMSRQIQLAHNDDDVVLFARYASPHATSLPQTYEEVPITALMPAFILSELKQAFLIGFQIYLPFLIVDLVVASVTTSMGMMMLPPAMVALPVKLLLFVAVDGWHLVVGMLLDSFQILA